MLNRRRFAAGLALLASAGAARAPAGTPEPIVTRLNEVMNASLRDRKIAETLDIQGIVPRPMSAPDYRAFVVAEAEKFGRIVQQANIKLQN